MNELTEWYEIFHWKNRREKRLTNTKSFTKQCISQIIRQKFTPLNRR